MTENDSGFRGKFVFFHSNLAHSDYVLENFSAKVTIEIELNQMFKSQTSYFGKSKTKPSERQSTLYCLFYRKLWSNERRKKHSNGYDESFCLRFKSKNNFDSDSC